MPGWSFAEGGGLNRQEGLKAPIYDDVFTDFGGVRYMTGYDPALATTLNAGNAGNLASGLGAFLASNNNNDFNSVSDELEGGSRYNESDMRELARGMGIDVGERGGRELQDYLDSQLQDYIGISGMSAGWNPTGNARGANGTIYKREGGKLVPIQTRGYVAPEEGGWLEEHSGILAPLAVLTGGLAYGAMGGGAAASGGAAAGGGGGAAAGTGIYQGIANSLGLGSQWASLPGWGQGMISGALQGGVQGGLSGGNILQGALRGAVSGGVGAGASGALGGMGVPSGLANFGGRLAGNVAGGLAGGLMQGSGSGSTGRAEGGLGGTSGSGSEGLLGAAPVAGMAGGVGLNPMGVGIGNDVRQQLIAKDLATTKRAGDALADNPLIRALRGA